MAHDMASEHRLQLWDETTGGIIWAERVVLHTKALNLWSEMGQSRQQMPFLTKLDKKAILSCPVDKTCSLCPCLSSVVVTE